MRPAKARLLLSLAATLTVTASVFSAAPAPSLYSKQPTWSDTILAMRAALNPKDAAFKPYLGAILQSKDAPLPISVDVSGLKELWLLTTTPGREGDDRESGLWADAKLIDAEGKETLLGTLKPSFIRTGRHDMFVDKSRENRPLKIGEKQFTRGLWAVANASICYRLDSKYKRFEATIGVDGIVGKGGQVRFEVRDRRGNDFYWQQIENDFPRESDWLLQDAGSDPVVLLQAESDASIEKKAIAHAIEELGPRATAGLPSSAAATFKTELNQLTAANVPGSDARWLNLYAKVCEVRREIRLRPLLAKYPKIVFTKHHIMGGSHYAYTEAQSDAQSERTFMAGAALCLLELNGTSATIRNLLEEPNGVIRDPDVSADGQRILFAWKKSDRKDDYHLYEMEVSSGKTRQLTDGLGYADYEGVYLPNGDIVFNSTRCVQTVDCYTTEVSNLYTCNKDGKYLRRLGYDQVHTNFPQVLNDGRVVYTRWEYNDRGQVYVQGLMQMNADGTSQTEFYGNNSWFPTTILHARPIPGSNKLVAVASGHHSRQTGKLILVDNDKGQQENSGVQLIAPVRDTPAIHVDAYGQDGELWQYPYPLSEKEFLVTFAPHGWDRQPVLFGLYFMDLDGRRELLVADPKISCNQSVPLAPRSKPPVRPSLVDYRKTSATYYMQDVYTGPGLAGIPRGTIKKLRVIALDYRLALVGGNGNGGPAGGAFVSTPVAIGHGCWDPKIVLGDATVYEDGSAFFEVPARTPLYFQALDEKNYMVQSMRSWSTLQPGESASCVGCHENKSATPLPPTKSTYAFKAGAQKLQPFYGPARGFSFVKEVQPILDKRCVCCHDDRSTTLPLGTIRNDTCETISPVGAEWQYAAENPPAGWERPEFSITQWKTGKAPLGVRETVTKVTGTDVWMRRTFEMSKDPATGKVLLRVGHQDDAEIYLNGVLACKIRGGDRRYPIFPLSKEALAALKKGSNLLAVHCTHSRDLWVDVGVAFAPASAIAGNADQPHSFSLLGTETLDVPAKRKWSDAYLALTQAQIDPSGRNWAGGHQNDLITWINAQSAPPLQSPYLTGAAKSKLMTLLTGGHYKVTLSREELDKIAAWVDLAVPYCGDYLEANAWSADDMQRHERLDKKRKLQQDLERKAIEELLAKDMTAEK
ncbi:MAG TPA: NPCBM/NEW2 domain-containing protein [Planctomycetota bacterium]|jgi:hypothetical protein